MIYSTQLTLPLSPHIVYAQENFFRGTSNELAFRSIIEGWPQWLSYAQILVGPQGSGKTHLSTILEQRTQGLFLKPQSGLKEVRLSLTDITKKSTFIIDDLLQEFKEDDIFHLINLVREYQGNLLIVARDRPQTWEIKLPDLKSRLYALPVYEVSQPDDEILYAVLKKRFSDYQLLVSEAIISYILTRIERSFKAAHLLVERLNKEALTQKKAPNLIMAKNCLNSL